MFFVKKYISPDSISIENAKSQFHIQFYLQYIFNFGKCEQFTSDY